MNNRFFFGDKEVFGIEIEVTNWEKKRGKIRFWIKNKSMGTFKRQHTFSYLVTALKKLLEDNNYMSVGEFINKTPEQTLEYALIINKDSEDYSHEDTAHLKRMLSLSPYFGDQLDSVTKIIYAQNGLYHFIWSINEDYSGTKKSRPFKFAISANVNINYFKKVVFEFLNWYNDKFSSPSINLN